MLVNQLKERPAAAPYIKNATCIVGYKRKNVPKHTLMWDKVFDRSIDLGVRVPEPHRKRCVRDLRTVWCGRQLCHLKMLCENSNIFCLSWQLGVSECLSSQWLLYTHASC
ncbi:hypothetical protein Poly21_21610 [Allorhodopirellula heiligendammensis]|uniref:Uncharacterized protein n=1 Tax=Allorhodopirellula heiligendammensis TaxID=2714739 RepID=A0A5C6C777_9BACT|nr:hypothetical protein Poly21_21610 [Allorhodopirellula heiligendammensis]